MFYGKEMNSRKYTYLVVEESATCSDYILKEECLVSCYYLILVGYDSLDKTPIKGAKWCFVGHSLFYPGMCMSEVGINQHRKINYTHLLQILKLPDCSMYLYYSLACCSLLAPKQCYHARWLVAMLLTCIPGVSGLNLNWVTSYSG